MEIPLHRPNLLDPFPPWRVHEKRDYFCVCDSTTQVHSSTFSNNHCLHHDTMPLILILPHCPFEAARVSQSQLGSLPPMSVGCLL